MKKLILVTIISFTACTDAEIARMGSFGEPHIIQLYSGGKVVAEWESTGKVECSDGGICSFMDKKTGKLVRTSGDIVAYVK